MLFIFYSLFYVSTLHLLSVLFLNSLILMSSLMAARAVLLVVIVLYHFNTYNLTLLGLLVILTKFLFKYGLHFILIYHSLLPGIIISFLAYLYHTLS